MAFVLALLLVLPFRIDAGPYAGAYRLDPGGAVNWYFATTALLRLPRLPLAATRAYLDAYLAHLDPSGGIADVLPMVNGIYAPIAPDSDDAYAGTLLSLAARYERESHDAAWWHASIATLQAVAYAKLLTQVKPDGLIRASQIDPTGYLMDNVEDYAGLRDFATALRTAHDGQADYVHAFIAPLGQAIYRLYDPQAQAFRWSDSDPIGDLVPYPSCVAQLYPELYDVRSGDRALESRDRAGARATTERCDFSLTSSPHEALLYALYISGLANPSVKERRFLAIARRARPRSDLIVASLSDALADDHPRARSAR